MAIETHPHTTLRYTSSGVRIECETHIQAPREVVWDLIQDPSRRVEWDARVTDVALQTPLPIGKGSRLRSSYGALIWIELELTTWQPSVRSAARSVRASRGNLFESIVGSWNFSSHPDGSTTWKTQILVRGVGGRFAPILERVLVGPVFKWLTVRSAKNLQRLAEREARLAQALVPAHA
jgi:hypothetical protein